MDKYAANRYIWLKQQIAAGGGSVPQELIDEVESLDAIVNGDETQDPPVVGLVDIVGDLENSVEDIDTTVNGDSTTTPATPGLVDRVASLEVSVDGDPTATPPIPPLLAGAGNMRVSTLWVNSDDTQDFSGDINLSSSDYDYYLMLFKVVKNESDFMMCMAPKGSNMYLNFSARTGANDVTTTTRIVSYVTDTKLNAGDATITVQGSSGTTNNGRSVPSIVLGIKVMSN